MKRAIVALALLGCGTLTSSGERVRWVPTLPELTWCKPLGEVKLSAPFWSREYTIATLRNRAGEIGADAVWVEDLYKPTLTAKAQAFRCAP